MFIDVHNEFSSEQAVTASAVSENILDVGKNAGAGQPLRIHCMVAADFDEAGTSLQVGLRSAETAAGVASGTEHWVGPAVAAADLTQGCVFNLPPLPDEHGRYVGLYYTVAGGPFGAGAVDAALVLERQTNNAQLAVDTAS
ncbi:MAG: Bbp16 family capsid cement protein [Desulfovibrionaceae bacterium]|jgi:hypothetical protein